MIIDCKKFFAAGMTGVLLLSSASCGLVEMRDSSNDIVLEEETTQVMLDPAERKNTVETKSEVVIPAEKEPAAAVTVCLTGDIRIDDSIIRDAAARATEGKSYSFVRMFTGVFQSICSADIAYGTYSSANISDGSESAVKTPVESLAALADVGFDVLNTSGANHDDAEYETYGIADIDSADDISYIEKNGLTVAFLALESEDTAKVKSAKENADAVVVSVSWDGISDRETAAHNLALAGADVIVGDGNVLGGVEWMDTGDGNPTLCAYSLGNLIATSEAPYELCGGILEFTMTVNSDRVTVSDAVLSPSVVRYTEGHADYQLVMLEDYHYDLSCDHAVGEVNENVLLPYVRETVNAEFLDPDLRG